MFEVVPTPEFEAWFEQLTEPLAEEVTTAIELVASSPEPAGPEQLRRLLLWFDGGEPAGSALYGPLRGVALPVWHARSYLEWHHEVLLCLASPQFARSLAALDPRRAAEALREVERLKRLLHAQRVSSSGACWASAASPPRAGEALRRSFLDLLTLVGLESDRVLGSGSGLRELEIDGVTPRLRVLFGLDFPRRCLLALLGESLDRRYYGDSVRRAERSWARYCSERSAEHGAGVP